MATSDAEISVWEDKIKMFKEALSELERTKRSLIEQHVTLTTQANVREPSSS
jgi:hypothetical protein